MKYKCIIFDCDGTLLNTLCEIARAMNKALETRGFPVIPQEQYRDMVGWGIYRLAELALPQQSRTKENIKLLGDCASGIMKETQDENLTRGETSGTKPYPGIQEMLIELSSLKISKSKKIALAVLSNKPDAVLRGLMSKFFSFINFDAVSGMREGIAPKPDPSAVWELLTEIDVLPQDTIFAGDSEIDIETARNAGCYPLGVSWGFRSRAVLETAGAAKIIDKPSQLTDLLEAF